MSKDVLDVLRSSTRAGRDGALEVFEALDADVVLAEVFDDAEEPEYVIDAISRSTWLRLKVKSENFHLDLRPIALIRRVEVLGVEDGVYVSIEDGVSTGDERPNAHGVVCLIVPPAVAAELVRRLG